MSTLTLPEGVQITADVSPEMAEILTPDALALVATLHRAFESRRRELLEARVARAARLDAGELPDFLPETKAIRDDPSWKVAPAPADLQDRRAEITGPVDRKMIINALNSGAKVFMSDFEDSNTPTWENTIQGQINLRDAVNGTITLSSGGKEYALGENLATLLVRPRGWHLLEKHVLVDGEPVSAGIFDFALYMFHNAKTLLAKGSGPYFYLPKMESHLEARLWNDIIVMTQDEIGVPQGSVRATVLIETILAAFEMEEILYELRDHSAGLNCGRWDYIFSVIKKFRSRPDFVLADRALVTMTTHFMNSYSLLAIKTCHKRGAHAIGGMAAQIPIKNDPQANEEALAKVRADKEREAGNGHDGTWVAHPGLVPIAVEAFDAVMPGPNQLDRLREDVEITAQDLLTFVPEGPITEAGLRLNISVGVQYLGAWLNGIGCVPINNLMEDAATAEISRSQVWQWIHSEKGVLDDGRKIDTELFRTLLAEELDAIHGEVPGEPPRVLRPRRAAVRRHLHLGRLRQLPDAARVPDDRLNAGPAPSRFVAGRGLDGALRGGDAARRMRLMLMRHGVAEDAGPDTGYRDEPRALTDEGRARIAQAAEGLRVLGIDAALVLASPLVRCRQTAEIVAAALGLDPVQRPAPAAGDGAGGPGRCPDAAPGRRSGAGVRPQPGPPPRRRRPHRRRLRGLPQGLPGGAGRGGRRAPRRPPAGALPAIGAPRHRRRLRADDPSGLGPSRHGGLGRASPGWPPGITPPRRR